MSDSAMPPMIFQDDFVEHSNIGWRIEQAQQDAQNPLMLPKYPWDSASPCIGHGTVLKDPIDGRFKAWMVAIEDEPPRDWVLGEIPYPDYPHRQHIYKMQITYAVSEDGVTWERPELDICAYEGYEKTNLLFYGKAGRSTYASVMIDPKENPDEPYEMFVFHDLSLGYGKDTVEGFQKGAGLFRYRSNDGIHWRPVEGPTNFLKDGDSLYVFRDEDGTYRMHHKIGMPAFPGGNVHYDCYPRGVRTMWQRTSADGTHWSERYPVLLPEWRDHHGDQFMDLQYHRHGEGVIALTTLYHSVSQNIDVAFAASRDGKTWWRPSRQPCLPNAPLGDYGGGMIWLTRDLIEHDGRFYLYYGATQGIHGDTYAKIDNQYLFYGGFCRASWEIGRLWAAVPATGGPVEGRLMTPLMELANKSLTLNSVTAGDGFVTAELLDAQRNPIPGFTRNDAIPFTGDDKFARFRWQGGETIPVEKAHLRLILKRARLYGYRLA